MRRPSINEWCWAYVIMPAKKPESRLQLKIRKELERVVGGFWIKFWGGLFTRVGIPDLIGCVEGRFFGLEVKMPGESPSAVQRHVIGLIRKAGGVAEVVTSPQEAIDAVRQALPVSERSR